MDLWEGRFGADGAGDLAWVLRTRLAIFLLVKWGSCLLPSEPYPLAILCLNDVT